MRADRKPVAQEGNALHVPSSIRTNYGLRIAAESRSPLVSVTITKAELHMLVCQLDRASAEAEQAGRLDLADRLARRAAGLRGTRA